MKLFRKRRKLNNKGLSLVELVCAVAIFGLATTVIGGAMVVSAQNYSRGTYELDVQQEAQTTTNLIGDLLYDATGATFDGSVANPVMKIQGENIEYHITFDKTNNKLVYEEYVTGVATPATGTLAENVKNFSATNLDAAGNNFKADKNVEIKLEIEKNGRTYEAEYSTTARNGVAESVGVAETAEIIIETSIVLEPGQTYQLPFEVVGSITNKAISIADGSGVTAVESGSNISVSVAASATGTIPFTISTIEQAKDVNGNPTGVALATKTVNVNVRRVNAITSPQDTDDDEYAEATALKAGNNCKNGATYQIDFTVAGDFMDKVYGKAYDTNYVNPRQVDIAYTMTGNVEPVANYIGGVQIVGVDNPSIKFNLIKDMPSGSEIVITATAKHPAGTNKTGNSYGTVVDVVKIKCENNYYTSSQLLRGTDGNQDGYGNKAGIWMTQEQLLEIRNAVRALDNTKEYWNYYSHLLTIYEVDASGNKSPVAAFPTFEFGSSMEMQIDDEDSLRLIPNVDYIYRMELMFYKDAAKTQPLWTVSPYSQELPVDSAAVSFKEKRENGLGYEQVSKNFVMTKGNMIDNLELEIRGLEMSSKKDYVKFVVEKFDETATVESEKWKEITTGFEYGAMNGVKNTGIVTMKLKFDNSGRYRIKVKLENFPYTSYDGTTTLYYTDYLKDLDDPSGYFYITVN